MSSSRYNQGRPAALARSKRPAALAECSSTRRRRTTADAAVAAATRDSSSWASLHEDLVGLIAWRVLAGDLRDYIRFRAVCPNWRSSTSWPRGRSIVDRRFHPRRWMLLPEGHGLHPGHGKLRGFVRFFNLSTGAFVRVHLPLDGILLLQRDHDTATRLLHPFTGDILDFPPLETLLRYVCPMLLGDKWFYIRSIRAASLNVSVDEAVSLMILGESGMLQVAFATSGEQQWKVASWYLDEIFSQLSFQGKLYAVCDVGMSTEAKILQIDPPELDGKEAWVPPSKLIAKCPVNNPAKLILYYLVECNSEVLVVAISSGIDKKISVYRLAVLIVGRTVPLTCIDGNALFIGRRNLCVSSKAFHILVGDTIVFQHGEGRYFAQYHLSRGTLLPASDGSITENALSSPRSIIYHIYTCCYRELWNKGQIKFHKETAMWRVKGKLRIGDVMVSLSSTVWPC